MFLAPETACGKEYCSNRKLDIWALGIILFRMIEGVYPFDGKNSKEVVNNIMKKNLEFNKKIKISKPMKNLIGGMLEKNHRFRIDDDSELFNKWFEFIPIRKNATIGLNTVSKESIFDNNTNRNNESMSHINNDVENININAENKKDNNNNIQNFPYSNIVRGKSHKNNNKYKLFVNINNEKKLLNIKQNLNEEQNNNELVKKNKYSKFRKIIENLNALPSTNNQEIEKNNKNKQLILPMLSGKSMRNNKELISSPFKTRSDMKKLKIIEKTNLPIYGNNLFKNKIDLIENTIKSERKQYTGFLNKNENLNNNKFANFSNYSCKKRATSDFKNKILQTINGNLFNNKNENLNNNNLSSVSKNINTQHVTSFNESPIKRNTFKSLGKNNRNISSYEMGGFPLIVD